MATATERHLASGADDCELLIAFESEHMKNKSYVLVKPHKYPHLPKPSKKYLRLTDMAWISDCLFVLHSDKPVLPTFDCYGGVLEQLSYHEHQDIRQELRGGPTLPHRKLHSCPDIDVFPYDSSEPEPELLDVGIFYHVVASEQNRRNISRELFTKGLVKAIFVKSAISCPSNSCFPWLKRQSIRNSYVLLYLKGNVLVSGRHLVGGVALSDLLWPENRRELRVRFLEGSEFVKEKVKFFARIWEKHANIRFVFIDSGSSDIRIAFRKGKGSNSYVGTENLLIPEDQATMNLGWFDESTQDTEFSRTTLHEFGHALGLAHEHMSPVANIPWDKSAVYQFYSNWTKEKVDHNVFRKYDSSVTRFTEFDSISIMCYEIRKEHTSNGYATSSNTDLSDVDKVFAGQLYPFGPPANAPTRNDESPVKLGNHTSQQPCICYSGRSLEILEEPEIER